MNSSLLAPCGMNCSICLAYLRDKKRCPGCRFFTGDEPVTIARCNIKNCPTLKESNVRFCFECEVFPCSRIRHMDTRYRTRYHMSTIENLKTIKKAGVRTFLTNERRRWTCPHCGGTICVHRGICFRCGEKRS